MSEETPNYHCLPDGERLGRNPRDEGYARFGPEWEKEVMKWRKEHIVRCLGKALGELDLVVEALNELKDTTSCTAKQYFVIEEALGVGLAGKEEK